MQLFETEKGPATKRDDSPQVVGVAVNAGLWRQFDYAWPNSLGPASVGQRVRVPFGRSNRCILGFVSECGRAVTERKLKSVAEVIDSGAVLSEELWELGQWISRYYLTPLGMTLPAMVPSAVGRHRPRSETVVFLVARRRDWPGRLGGKQKRALDELWQAKKQGVEPVTLEALLANSSASRNSVMRLRDRQLIRLESRPVRLPELADQQREDDFELNDDQREVTSALEPKMSAGFSCTLLYGVTGSGKTEVYIRAIRKVIRAGRQAIVLAPEIALATQTLQRLLKRLPRVAILHSGLTNAQRAFYYQQIQDGHASVIVGPRSAVFAPAGKLGLIIVDEEHEATYKQDTAPRYHARDVAVKRASIEEVPVILGSATPSLESLQNVRLGRYEMLRLPRRVLRLPMPKLQIVSLRKEVRSSKVELVGKTLTNKIAAVLDRGEQIILLMNRRGYASYVFCPKCDWRLSCDHCTRLLVFHRATQMAMCHYCRHTTVVPDSCPACGGKLVFFGLGIQRIDSELARKFPLARVARMDSDTMTSPKQFRKVLEGFANGELDILLGTQMVAKGLDFPKVSLVGVISADTSLDIPDFRAAERTFQLIVQVAGRAGRSDRPGEVVVQTVHESQPALRYAVEHDFDGFAEQELPFRRELSLPPFARMVRFIVRHEKLERAETVAGILGDRLRTILPGDRVTMFGPQPAAVKKIRDQFRFQVLLVSRDPGLLQKLLLPEMPGLSGDSSVDVLADVDPINLF